MNYSEGNIKFSRLLKKFLTEIPIEEVSIKDYLVKFCTGGKQKRPKLTLELFQVINPSVDINDEFFKDLVALELIHSSTLIHDDIIDNGDFRRGYKTINKKFGTDIALLVGNILKDYAISISSERGATTINCASRDINIGQINETLSRNYIEINIFEYLDISLFKTGKIFKYLVQLCKIHSLEERSLTEEESLFQILALLYQISDDWIDITTTDVQNKNVGQDYENNVHSFMYATWEVPFSNSQFKNRSVGIIHFSECINTIKERYDIQGQLITESSSRQLKIIFDLCNEVRKKASRICTNTSVLDLFYKNLKVIELSLQKSSSDVLSKSF